MSGDPTFSRRTMLALLGATGVVGAFGLSGCAPEAWSGLVAIGQAYLSRHPGEATREALLAHLPPTVGANASPAANLQAAAPQVAADLARGATVVVTGWTLSKTEARICALWSLVPPPTTTTTTT